MDGQLSIFDYIPKEEPKKIVIAGLCDDAYCPKCDYGFITADLTKCPNCGQPIFGWDIWHKLNDLTIEEFDDWFNIGTRFKYKLSKKDKELGTEPTIVEITDMRKGEINAQIKNITNEKRGLYVGERFCLNKTSYGYFYRIAKGEI